MDWAHSRDEGQDYMADLSRPATHPATHPEFSPLVNALLAPPSNWPGRESRPDLRFEFSLAAAQDFDTDSANGDLEYIVDDDELSSDLRGAVSASDETSVVNQSVLGQPQQQPPQQQDLVATGAVVSTSNHADVEDNGHQQKAQSHSTKSQLPDQHGANHHHHYHHQEEVLRHTKTTQTHSNDHHHQSNVRLTHSSHQNNCSKRNMSSPHLISTAVTSSVSIPKAIKTSTSHPPTAAAASAALPHTPARTAPKHEAVCEEERMDSQAAAHVNGSGNTSNNRKSSVCIDISDEANTAAGSVANSCKTSNTSGRKPSKTIAKRTKKGSNTGNKKTRSASWTPAASSISPSSMSAGTGSGLSHTKQCRDRLNNAFERLKHTLPPPAPGVEVKHKAQVLDYAIMVFKGIVSRTSELEIELAVSSNKATMEWIWKVVSRMDTLAQAAEEVMRLFIRRRGWLHAELWTATKRPGSKANDVDDSVVLSLCMGVENDGGGEERGGLMGFSKASEKLHFRAKEGVPGRVWSSMRPEWVTGLTDEKRFRRCELARKYGLKVCLGVPVTITGRVDGVMCFYDVKHRPYDTQCLELAVRLAWALGNGIGGKRAQAEERGR